jgi:hypothetical protein
MPLSPDELFDLGFIEMREDKPFVTVKGRTWLDCRTGPPSNKSDVAVSYPLERTN